jgi:hypothetical protein
MTNDTLQAMQSALAAELLPGTIVQNFSAPFTNTEAEQDSPLDPIAFELVEDYTPFHESLLWTLQRSFFEEKGAKAWSEGIVPHYVTSNSFIARSYAQVALGFLRDAAARHPGQTVHIVELGAGVGQFSFHFMHWLDAAIQSSGLGNTVNFRYVMTDFAEDNIRFWEEHEHLTDWVERGLLDFARFDVTADESLHLRHSGDHLSPQKPCGPIFLIANYLFDTIPQALFQIDQGNLLESKLRLQVPGSLTKSAPNAELLPYLLPDYRHEEVPRKQVYPEAALNQVLKWYEKEIGQCSLLFPFHGLRCLERFKALSGGNLFVLSGDKGYTDLESVRTFHLPRIAHHGSFSLTVNYHAFGIYAQQQGGEAWFRPQNGNSITVCGFSFANGKAHTETALAWGQAIANYGPDDFFVLKGGMERNFQHFSAEELLSYITMTGYDPKALHRCMPYLKTAAKDLQQSWKADFMHILPRIMANYYPIGEAYDLEAEIEKLLRIWK